MGSRDRLEIIADRAAPIGSPPVIRSHLSLRHLISDLCGAGLASRTVTRLYDRLIAEVGHERFVLTEADPEALVRASPPQVARAIVAQRSAGFDFAKKTAFDPGPVPEQPMLF